MCTPVVVDANSVAAFQAERIGGVGGPNEEGMGYIAANCTMVVDEHILSEWQNCASANTNVQLNLNDWVADLAIKGRVKVVDGIRNREVSRHLRKNFGLSSNDIRYVCLSAGIAAHTLVSHDLDFYDPRHKQSPSATRERIIGKQLGRLRGT